MPTYKPPKGTVPRKNPMLPDFSFGPWSYERSKTRLNSRCIKNGAGHPIANTVGLVFDKTDEGNAILMIAAPQMLKVLREAYTAIASLPYGALGNEVGQWTGTGYPYKYELLRNIENALPKFQKEEEKKMIFKVILEDEYFTDDDSGSPIGKLLLSRSPTDRKRLVEIDITGDTSVTLPYKELEEALKYLKGESVIRPL